MERKLRKIWLTLLMAVAWTSANASEAADAKTTIAVVSDIHVMDPSLLAPEAKTQEAWTTYYANQRKMLEQSAGLFDQFVSEMITKKPDIVLITGDLTKDGEEESHKYVRAKLEILKNEGIKVFVIPGNHDFGTEGSPKQYKADGTTEPAPVLASNNFAGFYKGYGYGDDASKYDVNSLSYVAEPVEGLVLLAIDSHSASIPTATLTWLCDRATEAHAAGKQVIAMMHHPLFPHITGADLFISTYTVDDYATVRNALINAGVNVILTGHFHTSDIAKDWKDDESKAIYDINTGSLISYPCDYRILTLEDGMRTLKVETESIEVAGSKDWLKGRLETVAKNKMNAKAGIAAAYLSSYINEIATFAANLFILHAEGNEQVASGRNGLQETYEDFKKDAIYRTAFAYGGITDASVYSILDNKCNYGNTTKENQTDDRTLTIDLPEIATIAASGYSTLVSIKALDFTNVEGLQGYVATSVNKEESKVTLTEVASVPVKTPVILKGTPGATYTIFTTTSPAELPAAGNLLRGSATESTTLAAGEAYILYNGAFYSNEAGNLPAGKAYLPASTVNGAREMSIVFDSEPTAIAAPKASTRHTDIYNLQGQIVNTPSKGVYVVEGKKVVVK
jgi:predicted MPP superfamily phosphohydrolase